MIKIRQFYMDYNKLAKLLIQPGEKSQREFEEIIQANKDNENFSKDFSTFLFNYVQKIKELTENYFQNRDDKCEKLVNESPPTNITTLPQPTVDSKSFDELDLKIKEEEVRIRKEELNKLLECQISTIVFPKSAPQISSYLQDMEKVLQDNKSNIQKTTGEYKHPSQTESNSWTQRSNYYKGDQKRKIQNQSVSNSYVNRGFFPSDVNSSSSNMRKNPEYQMYNRN